jgi:uncharacterized protein YkwD
MPRDLRQAVAFLVGFWIALVVFGPLAAPRAWGAPAGDEAALARALHAAVNQYRAENRLIPLERRPDLDAVALAHSRDMARRRYLSHESPEGANWVDRLALARVEGFALAGENVGLTTRADPNAEILRGWVVSKVHRDNLLARPYNATGIGVARGADGTLYYTQLYLTFPR